MEKARRVALNAKAEKRGVGTQGIAILDLESVFNLLDGM